MKKLRPLAAVGLALIVASCCIAAQAPSYAAGASSARVTETKAAAGYRVFKPGSRSVKKAGAFYFKTTSRSVSYSKNKNSGYRRISTDAIATNGTEAYYFNTNEDNTLRKMNKLTLETGETAVTDSLPVNNGDVYAYITAARGSFVYWTKFTEKAWACSTYQLDTKTGKSMLVMKNCDIFQQSGQYVLAENRYHSDVSAVPVTLCRMTLSGKFVKVRKLSKYCMNGQAEIIGSRVYFLKGVNRLMSRKAALYKAVISKGKVKKVTRIRTFKTKKDENGFYQTIMVRSFRTKYCLVYVGNKLVKVKY
ncbi:MAG: hypothetical protein ACI4LM_07265 [Anaerovoracaceae bacterium]